MPDSYREGSFGLGAGRLRTVFRVVLPSAMPGVLGGIILAHRTHCGRDGGADLYCGNGRGDSGQVCLTPRRTLAVHMYALSS